MYGLVFRPMVDQGLAIEEKLINGYVVFSDVGAQLGRQLCAEPDTAVALILGVLLDDEPFALRICRRDQFNHGPAHGQHPRRQGQIARVEFDQLAPPQSAFNRGLDEQLILVRGDRFIDRLELFRSHDRARFFWYRGSLDSTARMQEHDERGGEKWR